MFGVIEDLIKELYVSIKISFSRYWFLWIMLSLVLFSYAFSLFLFGFEPYGFLDILDYFISLNSSIKGIVLAVSFATLTAMITLTININEANNNKKYEELSQAYNSIIDGYEEFDNIVSDILSTVLHVSICNMLFKEKRYSADEFDEIRYDSYHYLIKRNHDLDSCLHKNKVKQLIYANELLRKKIDLLGDDKIFGVSSFFSEGFKKSVIDFIYESNDSSKIDKNIAALYIMVSEYRKKSCIAITNMALNIKGESYKKSHMKIKQEMIDGDV